MNNDIYSESWKNTNRRHLRQLLFRLQCRLWKAVRVGDMARARNLQKLLLKSYAARMLAIRQVTQLNTGQKTAGIDGKKSLTFKERFQLEAILEKHTKDWLHQGLREIPIPKKDGSQRILKVPTIADRAWQCLAKYALEPAHEATFHGRSYGFRPGRSTHDAQKVLQINLNSRCNGIKKRVLELDIEKCFDRISHKAILDRIIAPNYIKQGIFRCLKSGVNPQFPAQGTPQGGPISPLLANIALNGIEKIGEYRESGRTVSKCIRYADDLVYILKPGESAEKLLVKIEEFLAARGLNASKKKTKVTTTTDGFDFLGWRFYVQKNNGKFRSVPSEDNFQAFRQKVKSIVNNSNYGAQKKVSKLAPVVRGWRNYHKYCKMDGSRFSLWSLSHRTFQVFLKQESIDRYQAASMVQIAFPSVKYSENKFVNVKGEKSPFDGDIVYWSKRNSAMYDGVTARTLKHQNHSCAYCGLKFIDEDAIELHHRDGNHHNWQSDNLEALHRSCHQDQHMSKSERARFSEAG